MAKSKPPSQDAILALPNAQVKTSNLLCGSDHFGDWIPVAAAPAQMPREVFEQICEQLVLYPERSSSSILRCDILEDIASPRTPLHFEGYDLNRFLRRKILPRRTFDSALEQDCFFYHSSATPANVLIVLIPLIARRFEDAVPYYHPKVAGLAFRYLESGQDLPLVQIDFLPLEPISMSNAAGSAEPYYPPSSRTYRTALGLLGTILKYGGSHSENGQYEKRVHHDTIVPRYEFQDLYKQLKERYTWIIDEWKESTDPVKHVFEDVAIVTFLICLWKQMYPTFGGHPPGGFVDVGCGNGLLVFLLIREGYTGYGVDLRARKSWTQWGDATPLRTTTLSPPQLCLLPNDEPPFPPGSFLIGNHADELTPWLPLLAALTPESGFLNIPCCLHTLTGRFTTQSHTFPEALVASSQLVADDFTRSEGLSSEKGGRYNAYLYYVAEMTVRAGWRLEREALRIPSTKNWAFVGRSRLSRSQDSVKHEESATRDWIRRVARDAAGSWTPRKPEGKDH